MFKVNDKVISVLNNEDTDQIGIVVEVSDVIVVRPMDFPWVSFEYNLEGKHEEDTKFSIRKLERN